MKVKGLMQHSMVLVHQKGSAIGVWAWPFKSRSGQRLEWCVRVWSEMVVVAKGGGGGGK